MRITHGLTAEQVFLGNGSDEVLAHAFFAFFQQGCPLLMPDISYSFYKVYCGLYSIDVRKVPLTNAMQIEVGGLCGCRRHRRVRRGDCQPQCTHGQWSATGMQSSSCCSLHPQRVVLVDEAYVDFGGQSAIPLIARYPNLLVVHTLSKSRSLAGLRVGFACGQAHLIDALQRVKDSFNSYPLDRLAIAGGVAAFDDTAYFDQTRHAVMDSREGLTLALEDLGFVVLPSQANFAFVRHPDHDAVNSGGRFARPGRAGAPLQTTAYRSVPAHQRRYAAAM